MTDRANLLVLAAMPEELAGFPEISGVHKVVCGVGKVNAALAVAQHACESLSGVLIVGTAGAVDSLLNIGDVVIAADTLSHDVDVTALGFAPGQIPFAEHWRWESCYPLRALAFAAARALGVSAHIGRIITGDRFVADRAEVARLGDRFGASCLEMETAAVAQACERYGFPWLGVRVISDKADGSASVDFPTFLPKASATLARIVTVVAHEWSTLAPADPFADTLPPFEFDDGDGSFA